MLVGYWEVGGFLFVVPLDAFVFLLFLLLIFFIGGWLRSD